jgi:hypothetical protein
MRISSSNSLEKLSGAFNDWEAVCSWLKAIERGGKSAIYTYVNRFEVLGPVVAKWREIVSVFDCRASDACICPGERRMSAKPKHSQLGRFVTYDKSGAVSLRVSEFLRSDEGRRQLNNARELRIRNSIPGVGAGASADKKR